MSVRFLLYDDDTARSWHPFAATRPAGELLYGTETLRARAERHLGLACEGHLAGDSLRCFEEPEAPPCIGAEAEDPGGDRVYLSSRFVPDESIDLDFAGPTVLVSTSGPVGAWLPDGVSFPPSALSGRWPRWPRRRLAATVLGSVWELMAANADRITNDARRFPDHGTPPGTCRLGTGRVAISPDADVDPGAILDATAGPVIVDAGARVQAPCRIVGPAYVGSGSVLLGGALARSTIGPGCRVRGEVQATVMLGFANKAHEGYLGHSVVGRWANLGAMTTNSDLKNTYGSVRVKAGDRMIDTGMTKAGCLVGDHVRTGIGTLINTGTVIGAGTTVSGGGLVSGRIPPFSWGVAGEWTQYDIDRFMVVAERVMARRGFELTPALGRHYRRVFAATAPSRSGFGR